MRISDWSSDVCSSDLAGLDIGRGIKVDDHMVTSDPDILAVGECVEHDGNVYGLVAPLWDMCRSLADGLTDRHSGYRGSVTSTKLKVAGLDVFSAGDFSGGEGRSEEHTSELQSLMRISYAVFCLKKKT